MAAFVIGTKAKAFLDGLEIISGAIKLSTKGAAADKTTFQGVMGGPAIATHEVTINTPVFAASPLDVLALAQKLTSVTGILTIVDGVNGTTRTMNVMVSDKDESFDPEKAAEQDWPLKVFGEPLVA